MCTSLDLIRVRNQFVQHLRFILLIIRELSDGWDERVFSNNTLFAEVIRFNLSFSITTYLQEWSTLMSQITHARSTHSSLTARVRVCACGLTADAATVRNPPPGCDPAPDVITPPGRSWCIGNLATLSSRLLRRKGSANLTTWKALNVSQRALYGVE